jgi:hypothetical protein
VGGVQQMIIRQVADGAPVIVGGEHVIPEGRLVQSLFDQAEGVAALDRVRCRRRGRRTRELAERDSRAQATSVPIHDEGRDDCLVAPRRDAKEVDERDLSLSRLPEPDVLRDGRIGAHERVVQLLFPGEDLPVHPAPVVVPDPRPLSGDYRADAQEEGHPARLEDAALRVHKRPALTLERKPAGDIVMPENQIAALQAADVIERGLANDDVAGDQLVIRHGVHDPR